MTVDCGSVAYYHDNTSTATLTGWYDWASLTSLSMPVGGLCIVQGFQWRAKPVGAWTGFGGNAGDLTLWGGNVDLTRTDGTNKAFCDLGSALTGTLRIDNVKTVAGQFGLYMEDGVAHRVVRGPACDFSSCTTPIRKGTTSKTNFGTFTGNGTTPVNVTAACTAKDAVFIMPISGAPSGTMRCVAGADTFAASTAAAADTAVYQWWVVPGGP